MKYITKLALIALAMAGFNIQAGEATPASQGILSSLYSKVPNLGISNYLGQKFDRGLERDLLQDAAGYASTLTELPGTIETLKNQLGEAALSINTAQTALQGAIASGAPEETIQSLTAALTRATDNQNVLSQALENAQSMLSTLPEGIQAAQKEAYMASPYGARAYDTFMTYVPSVNQLRALPTYTPYFGSQWGDLSRNQQIGAGLASAALLGTLGYGAYRGGRSLISRYNRYMNQPMGIASMGQEATAIRALAQERAALNPEEQKQNDIMEALIFIRDANTGISTDRSKLTKSFFQKLHSDINGMQGLEDVAKEMSAVINAYRNANTYADVSNKKVLNQHMNKLKNAINKYLQ